MSESGTPEATRECTCPKGLDPSCAIHGYTDDTPVEAQSDTPEAILSAEVWERVLAAWPYADIERLRAHDRALRAEVERLTAERGALIEQRQIWIDEQGARVAALTEALRKYGRHDSVCVIQQRIGRTSGCTCGLGAVLGGTDNE